MNFEMTEFSANFFYYKSSLRLKIMWSFKKKNTFNFCDIIGTG